PSWCGVKSPLMNERHPMHQLKTRKPQQPTIRPAEPVSKIDFHATVRAVPATPASNDQPAVEQQRFRVGPLNAAGEVVDITQEIIEIIAREVWRRDPQGNDLLNWMEAERLFQQAMTSRG